MAEQPTFITSDDVAEVLVRQELHQNGLLYFWQARQSGLLKDVPTIS